MHTFWKIFCVHWAVLMNVGYSWKASSFVWLMMEALSSDILSISFPVIKKPTVSNQTSGFKKKSPNFFNPNEINCFKYWLALSFAVRQSSDNFWGRTRKRRHIMLVKCIITKTEISPFKSWLNTNLSSPSSLSICSLNNTFVYGGPG